MNGAADATKAGRDPRLPTIKLGMPPIVKIAATAGPKRPPESQSAGATAPTAAVTRKRKEAAPHTAIRGCRSDWASNRPASVTSSTQAAIQQSSQGSTKPQLTKP